MKALKQKIFDVLTKKISIFEFENWLYESKEVLNNLDSNEFYFDVVSVNYRKKNALKKLMHLTEKEFCKDFVLILSIEVSCLQILQANTIENVYESILPFIDKIDYDTDYKILLEFYNLEYDYNSFQYSILDRELFLKRAKFYASQVINNLNDLSEICDKKEALKIKLNLYEDLKNRQKSTLKQKIFAFFKKS